MQRRNFIKLSGVSMASLFVSHYLKAEGRPHDFVQMPETVRILIGNDYFPLQSSDKQIWSYRDVIIQIKKDNDVISIFIQSPSLLLREVQLFWEFSTKKESKVLGDAWERSYADLGFRQVNAVRKLPWYLVVHNENDTLCFGVKTGCNTFCYWEVTEGNLKLNLDTRNGGDGVSLGNRTLHAADIVATRNTGAENVFATARRFCAQMCDNPLTVKQPVYGINDWYYAYGKNSADLILRQTALLAPLAENMSNRPFSVVDDGWSRGTDYIKANGWSEKTDYTESNERFPNMSKLANEIQSLGMRPGLWTRPLWPKPGTKETLLIKDRGRVLDPSITENIEYIKSIFRLYRQWGFEMVKHDYTTNDIFGRWGMDMQESMTTSNWHFKDQSKTNAEIILEMYRSIRDASGDMYLIGCNSISHLSAGIFELFRIGDDTSGKDWKRTKEYGVNTMGFRMVQHKTFYEADGDCVGLTTAIPWEKNKQWMQLLAQSSAPLFISAQPEAVGQVQKEFIKKCFSEVSQILPSSEPLDWLDNQYPSKWKLNNRIVEFKWD